MICVQWVDFMVGDLVDQRPIAFVCFSEHMVDASCFNNESGRNFPGKKYSLFVRKGNHRPHLVNVRVTTRVRVRVRVWGWVGSTPVPSFH